MFWQHGSSWAALFRHKAGLMKPHAEAGCGGPPAYKYGIVHSTTEAPHPAVMSMHEHCTALQHLVTCGHNRHEKVTTATTRSLRLGLPACSLRWYPPPRQVLCSSCFCDWGWLSVQRWAMIGYYHLISRRQLTAAICIWKPTQAAQLAQRVGQHQHQLLAAAAATCCSCVASVV